VPSLKQGDISEKIRLLLICLTVFLSAAAAVSAQQQVKTANNNDEWVGKYAYTYTEPANNGGGFAPVVEYLLSVSREGDSLTAHFTADGTQTYDDFVYTTKIKRQSVGLLFFERLTSRRYASRS
jgi:hypothetical protein